MNILNKILDNVSQAQVLLEVKDYEEVDNTLRDIRTQLFDFIMENDLEDVIEMPEDMKELVETYRS